MTMEKNSNVNGMVSVSNLVRVLTGYMGRYELTGREVAKVKPEQGFWMHKMVESLIGEELASFWALNKAFWAFEGAENLISTDMVEAVQASYHEEEIHGLLARQKDIEFQIEERKEIVTQMINLKNAIKKVAKGAWCTLDSKEKDAMEKACDSMSKSLETAKQVLRDQVKDFDELCAELAQNHSLLDDQSEVSAIHEALEGFVDCLTLDQMITILEVVDSLKGSTDKKKEIKLSLLARLSYQAPQGGWGEDYARLLAWFKTRKEDMSQVVEIESNGHIGLNEDSMIEGLDARRRAEKLIAKGVPSSEALARVIFGKNFEKEFYRDETDMAEDESVDEVLGRLFVA
jgi:hypothetical protein